MGGEAPEADDPLHADLRLLAQPDRDLVQHLHPGRPERRGLEVQKGTRRPNPSLHQKIQRGTGQTLPVDLYRETLTL